MEVLGIETVFTVGGIWIMKIWRECFRYGMGMSSIYVRSTGTLPLKIDGLETEVESISDSLGLGWCIWMRELKKRLRQEQENLMAHCQRTHQVEFGAEPEIQEKSGCSRAEQAKKKKWHSSHSPRVQSC